jgi:hypothetical protein
MDEPNTTTNSNELVNTVPDPQAIATLREALLAVPVPKPPNIMTMDEGLVIEHEEARKIALAELVPGYAEHRRTHHGLDDPNLPSFIPPGFCGATKKQLAKFYDEDYKLALLFENKQIDLLNRQESNHKTACVETVTETGILPRDKAMLFHTYIAIADDASVPEHVKKAVYGALADLLEAEAAALIAQYHLPRPPLFCAQCSKRREDFDWGTCCSEECWNKFSRKRNEVFGGSGNTTREIETWSPHVSDHHLCRYCAMFYQRVEPVDDHGLCGSVCLAHFVAKNRSWRFEHEIIDVAQYIGLTWSKAVAWPAATSAQARLAYNRAVGIQETREEEQEKAVAPTVRNITPQVLMADRIMAAAPHQPDVVTDQDLKRRARIRPSEVREYTRERDRLVDQGRLGRRGRGTRGSGFEFWAQ